LAKKLLILRIALSKDPYRLKENYITAHPDVSWWQKHPNYQAIIETRPLISGYIADFGCNHGANTILMAREGNKAVGIDINHKAIETAKKLSGREKQEIQQRLEFICARFDSLPLADDLLDGGYMFDVFEHIYEKDRKGIFKEIKRVMKDGAKLLIITPFEKAYYDEIQHVAFYNVSSLKAVLEENGLKIIEIKKIKDPNGDKISALVEIKP
jgi:SAM-dependent methyltransferase